MTASETHNAVPAVFKGSGRLIVGIIFGVLTFWLFAQSVVNIVPAIQQDVAIPLESLNLAISLTGLFSGCFIVVAGGFADRFGRVKLTQTGFALSILGCLCLVVAQNTLLFAIGRIIQGFSAACIMPATLSLIKTYYQDEARQRALSFWSIGSWGGSGLCSLAGGAIATYCGWRWVFILSICCALAGMLLIRGTPESKANTSDNYRFDYVGLLSFVVMLICLNWTITKGNALGWLNSVIVIPAIVFVLAAALFFTNARRKKSASFIDFALFKHRAYSGAVLSNFLLNAVAGTLIVASVYVQQGRGFSAFQSGMLTIGYLVAVLGMIRVGEKLLQKVGARKPMMWGTAITGTGVALMALTQLPDSAYVAVVLIGYILFGLGLGFYATPSTDTAISSAPEERIGVASGIYKMASSLGGAFGIAISASAYAAMLSKGPAIAATTGLLVNVLFCAISFLVIVIMVPRQK
ncbi:MFS transporter [Mixta intestinalis]|jgi:DHA2 family multidrug resistance protein-like MFS transporter|uniref:Quinolone resistance protein NorB n=1 Tax=Mixta intestinalis TaxID=1615494 RepID=A0A6P1Q2Q5_9GAMM|nr:MFS transporter [Mixta intestinalis]QHM72379.1 Quinolone resistance protein NorB [Mixta intestinalis]